MTVEKHKSEQWLREQYVQKERPATEIAEEIGVTTATIYYWLEKNGIDRDATRYGHTTRVPYATYYHDDRGYPRWQAKGREDGERVTDNFHVHRLLAIAEYGVSEVSNYQVHHKNGLKWDNRPGNIELVGPAEHRKHHRMWGSWFDRLRVAELYENGSASLAIVSESIESDIIPETVRNAHADYFRDGVPDETVSLFPDRIGDLIDDLERTIAQEVEATGGEGIAV